ncbi:MAG: M28 family metallopeptidase [Chloroflexota bacterium]|jgi:aminopeptidase YwaD
MHSGFIRRLEKHLQRLSVEIGPRPIGSPANHAACCYIGEVFDAAGLEIAERSFQCPDWRDDEAVLELGSEQLPVVANVYSPSCDLSGSLAPMGTVAEMEQADLEGRIGLLFGDLTREPLIPKDLQVYNSERDQRIHQLLEERCPAALITVSHRSDYPVPLIEEWDLAIPSATVPPEAGLALLDWGERPVRLKIVTRSTPSHAATLLGSKAGDRAERLVLCAHYDTKVRTPGALDNASGIAVLLALAEELADRKLDTGLVFAAFADHEYFITGNGGYEARIGLKGDEILAAINMDGAGYRLGANTVALMAASDDFKANLDTLMKRHSGTIWTEPWPQSDHSSFSWWGIPSVAISSVGGLACSHTPADAIELVGLDRLAEAASLVAEIIESLQHKPITWARSDQTR